ncbi:hypothetical protein SBA6_420018 [Candidatus Sulfopaludibacter sp. SbA6]|nr:hypothetical protein SBA6_420018 [Candidatus Sulfopaludibacter sp. SbA6]
MPREPKLSLSDVEEQTVYQNVKEVDVALYIAAGNFFPRDRNAVKDRPESASGAQLCWFSVKWRARVPC